MDGWMRMVSHFQTTSYAHFYAFWTTTSTTIRIHCLLLLTPRAFRRQCRRQRLRLLQWFCALRAGRRSKQREMFVVFVNLKPLANIWLCVHIIYWNIGIVLMKGLTFPKFVCVLCLPMCGTGQCEPFKSCVYIRLSISSYNNSNCCCCCWHNN